MQYFPTCPLLVNFANRYKLHKIANYKDKFDRWHRLVNSLDKHDGCKVDRSFAH